MASTDDSQEADGRLNIIKQTRKIIKEMTKQQRLEKAASHLSDALDYKSPRPNSLNTQKQQKFKMFYRILHSSTWEFFRLIVSYVYMYLVAFDCNDYTTRVTMESIALTVFICDTIMQIYCKAFDQFKVKSRYTKLFWGKILVFLCLIADLLLFSTLGCKGNRPIVPFRVLRVSVPIFYDTEMRKAVQSFFAAYLDVIAFLIFQSFLIVSFAIVASRSLSYAPTPVTDLDYRNQYDDLSKMIFIMYVVSTYDSYPDNQLIVIKQYQPNYIIFVIFIFMNMFIFSSIPGSLIYSKFKETRSKILIVDEIKQQTSLILAFVTLAEQSTNLRVEELVEFLWYVYKFKVRYIEYIARICLFLDDHNHKYIQVNEFMKISKIMLSQPVMRPPYFADIVCWVKFRGWCNTTLHLKEIVNHFVYQLIVSLLLIASFTNAIILLYRSNNISTIFDGIFVFIFLIDLIIRIIAIGPQNFFSSQWNGVDTFLILAGVFLFIVPVQTTADTLLRMARIFRVVSLILIVGKSSHFRTYHFQLPSKLYKLFSTILAIFPIILKFVPILFLTFYVFGILGLQIFYDVSRKSPSIYNFYDQFSHFRDFIGTQLLMVQIMTEAGWSLVAFDMAARGQNFFSIMTYFALMHLIIVDVEAALLKGIYWEVYFTVHQQQENDKEMARIQYETEEKINKKKKQYQEIELAIDQQSFFQPNTLIRREFYENKLDTVIFATLKNVILKSSKIGKNKSMKAVMIEHMIEEHKINNRDYKIPKNIHIEKRESFQMNVYATNNQSTDKFVSETEGQLKRESLHQIKQQERPKLLRKKTQLQGIEQLEEQDIDLAMEQLLCEFIIDPRVKYSQTIANPKIFTQYLELRLKPVNEEQEQEQFNLNKHLLGSDESLSFHTFVLHSLLKIQTSKREQKGMIFDFLVNKGVMDKHIADLILKKKLLEVSYNSDAKGILRSVFMQEANEDLINKFQVEYFSDLYGESFRQINKLSVEPLIRAQAKLSYAFRNLCRYPRIQNNEFFEMLSALQDQMSNTLLKRGSLFKFVYKLDSQSDVWFSIGYKKLQEMRVHFIKSGIWLYRRSMVENKTYYGKDLFNWANEKTQQKSSAEAYIKRLYQSFESLAFSLLDEQPFFQSNPQQYVYDVYARCIDVKALPRQNHGPLSINKVMLIVMSKEERRIQIGEKVLSYELSDIKMPHEPREEVLFSFDETDRETLDKLKNLADFDKDLILEREGIPFTYINNLIVDIFDVFEKYAVNFVTQIQITLNKQFDLIVRPQTANLHEQFSHKPHSEVLLVAPPMESQQSKESIQ